MNAAQDLLRSPEHYPLRLDYQKSEISFVRMSRETYRDTVFLDTRTRHLGPAYSLRLDDVILATSLAKSRPLPTIYILHPAFCCSTLLSRYFELLPFCFVLREPLLLTQVALHSFQATQEWLSTFQCATKLLTRGYADTQWIVIKAHEPCNVLGLKLLHERDNASVIFLTTPQKEFVLSVLKSAERRAWIRTRVAEMLESGLGGPAWENVRPGALSDAQAAACMWSINNLLREELSSCQEKARVLLLESDQLLNDPASALAAIARACQLPLDDQTISRMKVHPAISKYSKDVSISYDASSRRYDMARLEDRFASELNAGLEWAARQSFPVGVA
jgi:hypothetical protein